jgi:hypothetical protein
MPDEQISDMSGMFANVLGTIQQYVDWAQDPLRWGEAQSYAGGAIESALMHEPLFRLLTSHKEIPYWGTTTAAKVRAQHAQTVPGPGRVVPEAAPGKQFLADILAEHLYWNRGTATTAKSLLETHLSQESIAPYKWGTWETKKGLGRFNPFGWIMPSTPEKVREWELEHPEEAEYQRLAVTDKDEPGRKLAYQSDVTAAAYELAPLALGGILATGMAALFPKAAAGLATTGLLYHKIGEAGKSIEPPPPEVTVVPPPPQPYAPPLPQPMDPSVLEALIAAAFGGAARGAAAAFVTSGLQDEKPAPIIAGGGAPFMARPVAKRKKKKKKKKEKTLS